MEIYLDKNKKAPVIKPVNGVQNGPVTFDFLIDETENFKAAGFPYSRLHDTEMLYGAGDFVNIHCIFPDMNKDPSDPSAYNFKCTDEYIKAIYDAGTKVFYRLGESIENNPRFKRYTVRADAKTAKIYTLDAVSDLQLTATLHGRFDLISEPDTIVYAEFYK